MGCRGAVYPCRGQGVRVSGGHLCAAEAPTEVTTENQNPNIYVIDYKITGGNTMKNRFIQKVLLAAVLVSVLCMSASGCGSAPETSGSSSAGNVTSSSAADTGSNTDSTTDSSSAESTGETDAFQAETAQGEVKVYTLAVREIPYDAETTFKDSVVGAADTATLITVLIDTPDASDMYEKKLDFADGRTNKAPEGGSLVDRWGFDVAKNGSKDTSGILYTLTCSGSMKPSDFVFTYTLNKEHYSVSIPDTVSPVPEEFLTSVETAHAKSILRMDGEELLCLGFDNKKPSSTGTNDEGQTVCTFQCRWMLKNLDADISTLADVSKFSYEPDENAAKMDGISQVTVTFSEGEPNMDNNFENRMFNQFIDVSFSYVIPEGMTEEEKQALDNCAQSMIKRGCIVYSGADGQLKFSIS